MYPPYDLGAARVLRRAGSLSLVRWLVQAFRANQPVFQWGDPGPGIQEFTEWVGHAIARRLRRIA
jgi:hypothetical protein